MKRKSWLIFIIILIIIGTFFYLTDFFSTFVTDKSSEEEKTASEQAVNEEKYRKEHPIETEISSYSTKILDQADGRLTNIRITCDTLNGYILSAGETFSFEDLVQPVSEERGYQKAKVIENGEAVQALGGGNCQVSSTLYNAVLECENGLEVVERHPHGKKVAYVPEGRDAAVSHGSQDFKFKNNLANDVKIYLSSDDENVYASIVELTY